MPYRASQGGVTSQEVNCSHASPSRIFLRNRSGVNIAGPVRDVRLREDATGRLQELSLDLRHAQDAEATGFSRSSPIRCRADQLKDVKLEALLTDNGKPVQSALPWRVFSPIPGSDGKLPLLATSEGRSTAFNLVPGEYFVNVALAGPARPARFVCPKTARSTNRCSCSMPGRHAERRLRQRCPHPAERTSAFRSSLPT